MTTITRLLTAICAASAVAASLPGDAARAAANVPTPTVTAVPSAKPGTPARDYPFFSTDLVLANYGYVEEEFFFEGTANTYSAPPLGSAADIVSSGTKYRSRLLVRRPTTPSRFNGVVVVEWFNVTNGYDTDVLWLYQKEFFLREGYAWVGVSAQNVGVSRPPNGLKVWSPKRYGTLDVDGGGKVPGDALSYDIYSQAAAAIRNVKAVLGGLKPTHVMAAGQSQSSGRLATYLNGIHVRDPIYDSAFLTVNTSPMRADLDIPLIKVLSENEAATSRNQKDSEKIRTWTVAGSTHSEQYSLLSRAAFLKRDLNLEAVDNCETPARSRVEIRYVYNAAVDALVKWKATGATPPHGPELSFDGTTLQRDRFGNALGGIRLAEIEAPVANESAQACGLGGTHVPFTPEVLNALYRTHEDYVAKVTAAANAVVKAGFLLPADGAQTIDTAKRSIYGMQLTCGPLCADVRQFPRNPSSMLLGKQTAYLLIKEAGPLVKIVDRVTQQIAEGDTLGTDPKARKKFGEAAAGLQAYINAVRQLQSRGAMAAETASLLIDQATTLQRLLEAKAVYH
jgi:alpha/beta hydrolase family protein